MSMAKIKNAGLQHTSSVLPKRVIGRPFPKGTSGNPSGKRKGEVSITAALKRLVAQGRTADEIAKSIVESVTVRKDAAFARLLLDRCDGVLSQQLSAHLSGGLPVVAPSQVVFAIPPNFRDDPAHRGDPPPPEIADIDPEPQIPALEIPAVIASEDPDRDAQPQQSEPMPQPIPEPRPTPLPRQPFRPMSGPLNARTL
jgi:hypothetical protein